MLGPGVVVLVDAVAESLQPAVPLLYGTNEVGHVLERPDVGEHPDHLLVRAAVARAVQGGTSRRGGRVGVDVRRTDDPHRGGRAVLLVVGVQDEQHVDGAREHGVGLKTRLGGLPHHREEVRREGEGVVGVHERHADAEAVRRRGERRHLRDEPDDLLVAGLLVEDVLASG